ncbi:unnamed protein product [Microthlaspi erraticum]|uniref:Uncharacterized protein n=1 Tax=Microthlaspi erraticum TaxID=1685480 RepID=A0A6D2K9X6_9BRAS|nr:unnamed protein product [Microthlaspi erraticum]
MSRTQVMIKIVKTGPDSLIEHSRPEPRTPADQGTNVPRPCRAYRPRPANPRAICDFLSALFLDSLVFWSILEHMGHEEHGGTWHMDAAQLDTQRKKGEAILKTSSTVYSTNRSSSSTRPAKLQLDRAEKSKSNPKNVASPLTFL